MSGHPPKAPADALLTAALDLPQNPAIVYARFAPAHIDDVEHARRSILARNPPAASLIDLILPSVHIGTESFIYAFKISSESTAQVDMQTLASLPLNDLSVAECSFFEPPSSTSILPNPDKRAVLSYFYEAVRSRVIDDIVTTSTNPSKCTIKRQVKRFKNGFLMSQIAPPSDWQYKAITRPLVFCQLQIHFSYTSVGVPSQLLIHPMLLPTPFLDIARSLPLPSGTPITLLPFGTPAYYLTSYTGPTSGLSKQFQASLKGLGAGNWETADMSENAFSYTNHSTTQSTPQSSAFIIAWIKVENKQGEDKGITIIYPTHLCLSYVPHASNRTPLDYFPELPAPLQPSPQVAATFPSLSDISHDQGFHVPTTALYPQRPAILSSPTSDSLHSFRALTLSKVSDLRQVANEVGGYVDAVARERERERERLKREREHGTSTSPRLVRASATTPASVSVPTPSSLELATSSQTPPISNTGSQGMNMRVDSNALAGSSSQMQRSHPLQSPPISLSVSLQNFYPSPPQGTPHNAAAPTSPAVMSAHGNGLPTSTSAGHVDFTHNNVHADGIPTETVPIPMSAYEGPSSNAVPHISPLSAPQSGVNPSQAAVPYNLYGMDTSSSGYINLDMEMEMDFGMGDLGLSFGMNMGGMNMDMGMSEISGMGMEGMVMDGLRGAPSGGTTSRTNGMEFEDAFTDDDFSFFDRPARAPPPPAPPTHLRGQSGGTGVGSLLSPPAMHFHDDNLNTGMPLSSNHMWTPGASEGLTPLHHELEHPVADPPGIGPVSEPATPAVHLSPSAVSFAHGLPTPHDGASLFEPIPFAAYHRRTDGKYANGKFALALNVGLPSPPAENEDIEEHTTAHTNSLPASPGQPRQSRGSIYRSATIAGAGNGWRLRYDAITDPRIGVVRKLIGVKRKPAQAHGAREPQRITPWASNAAHEDWTTPLSQSEARDGAISEAESDEDDEDDADADSADTPLLSRPVTPPPSYLPLGPALLHTHFEHGQLLALSMPLKPPGASIMPPPLLGPGAPPSVPTPVSPAATMGAASERGKSLEAAAQIIATEVVSNPIWAETWRAISGVGKLTSTVWASDCRAVSALLEGVPGMRTGLGLAEVFGIDTNPATDNDAPLQPLEAPMISLGKGDALIQVLPTAVRFWEKLGLDPKSGRKDFSAYVLFENEDDQRHTQVDNWLANLSGTYYGKHFGTMSLGSSPVCKKDGLIPVKFDATFRKILASFFAQLQSPQPTLVLFLVLPIAVMSLSSPVLRQILSVINKLAINYHAGQLVYQFIPEQHLFSSLEKTSGYESALDQLAFSVYDRIKVPVDRLRTQRLHPQSSEDIRKWFLAPSFTLARPLHTKVSFVRSAHASLDVTDRYTLLHVGYHLTTCGKWIIAACVDQRGEAYETNVWLTQSPDHEGDPEGSHDEYAVRCVWEFAMQFARKTNVEWRVVFARLGVMSQRELHAWEIYLSAHVTSSQEQPPLHHTLACVIPDASWSFIPAKSSTTTPLSSHLRANAQSRSSASAKQTPVFTDVSAMTYAIVPTRRIPISIPPSQADLAISQSLVHEPHSPMSSSPSSPHPHSLAVEALDSVYQAAGSVSTPTASTHSYLTVLSANLPHPITILPPHTSFLIRVPNATSSSAVCTTAIHLLRTFHSMAPTHIPLQDDAALLGDLTRNYYELAVLAKVRFRLDGLGGHKGLPFHLAAVDAMRMALDREWDRLDAVVDA